VGLGNPGAQYEKTRHNTGFRAVDYISGRAEIAVNRLKHMAKTGTGVIAGKKVLIMKPQTYMNASGQAVADASRFYKIPPENILVIFDDVSLDIGRLRIRRSGSDGGHNGVKSETEHLGTETFPRIKIGVGSKPNPEYDLADWVLSELSVGERNAIAEKYDLIYEAVSLIINGETEKAMQMCN
jgi:PTH1 family peptidyl-tRNA hydrolase